MAMQVKFTVPDGAFAGTLLSIPIRSGEKSLRLKVPEGAGPGSTLVLSKASEDAEWSCSLARTSSSSRAPAPTPPRFAVGETVEGLYRNGAWYPAVVDDVLPQGMYVLRWSDGDPNERFKGEDAIRKVQRSETPPADAARQPPSEPPQAQGYPAAASQGLADAPCRAAAAAAQPPLRNSMSPIFGISPGLVSSPHSASQAGGLPEHLRQSYLSRLATVGDDLDLLEEFLESLPEAARADKVVMMEAAKKSGLALEHASESLRADRELVNAGLDSAWYSIQYAHPTLKADRSLVLKAASHCGHALRHADPALLMDRSFMMEAVKLSPLCLEHARGELALDRTLVLEATRHDSNALKSAHEAFLADKEVVLEAIRQDETMLKLAHEVLRADPEVVREAVRLNPASFQHAHECLRANKAFVSELFLRDPAVLQHADESLTRDRSFMLEAVRQRGYALQYAHETVAEDREVVLEAVRRSSSAIHFASAPLRHDFEVLRTSRSSSLCSSGSALSSASPANRRIRKKKPSFSEVVM